MIEKLVAAGYSIYVDIASIKRSYSGQKYNIVVISPDSKRTIIPVTSKIDELSSLLEDVEWMLKELPSYSKYVEETGMKYKNLAAEKKYKQLRALSNLFKDVYHGC